VCVHACMCVCVCVRACVCRHLRKVAVAVAHHSFTSHWCHIGQLQSVASELYEEHAQSGGLQQERSHSDFFFPFEGAGPASGFSPLRGRAEESGYWTNCVCVCVHMPFISNVSPAPRVLVSLFIFLSRFLFFSQISSSCEVYRSEVNYVELNWFT